MQREAAMECTTHHTSNNLSKKIEEVRWVNSDPKTLQMEIGWNTTLSW